MFSSLTCRTDVPSGASAAAAASASIGKQNHDPNYSVLSDVAPCKPALILSIESDFTKIPIWIGQEPFLQQVDRVYSVVRTDGPILFGNVRYYRRNQTVAAIKTLLYLALFDSLGIPSDWHLGPVWFSPDLTDPDSDASIAMISMIRTGRVDNAIHACAIPDEDTYQSNLLHEQIDMTELDAHLDNLSIGTPLSACIVKLELEGLNYIRTNTALLAAGVFGVVRADKSLVYKASQAKDYSSTLRELICLAILTAKGSSHSPKLGCLYINEDLPDLRLPFCDPMKDMCNVHLTTYNAAKKLKAPASILTQQRISGDTLASYVSDRVGAASPLVSKNQSITDRYKSIILAVLDAIADMLANSIIHIDLHMGNIMLSGDGTDRKPYHATIIDFGDAGPLFDNKFEGVDVGHGATVPRFVEFDLAVVDRFIKYARRFSQRAPEATALLPDTPLSDKTFTYQAAILVADIICMQPNFSEYLVNDGNNNPVIRPNNVRFINIQFANLLDGSTKFDPRSRYAFSFFKKGITTLFSSIKKPFLIAKI